MRAVLARTRQEPSNLLPGLRLAGALSAFWEVHGHLAEGHDQLLRMLEADKTDAPFVERAKALNGIGNIACSLGNYAEAEKYQAMALAMWRELKDDTGIGNTISFIGYNSLEKGDYDTAFQIFEESLEIRRRLGDLKNIAASLDNLGSTAFYQKRYEEAKILLDESLELSRRIGDKYSIASLIMTLGALLHREGDNERATACYNECLEICRELGSYWQVAYSLEGLAEIASHQGDLKRAIKLCGAADALRSRQGFPLPPMEAEEHADLIRRLRSAMPANEYNTAWTEGTFLSNEAQVDYALSAKL